MFWSLMQRKIDPDCWAFRFIPMFSSLMQRNPDPMPGLPFHPSVLGADAEEAWSRLLDVLFYPSVLVVDAEGA